jgi:hypothetical protein
MLIGLKNRFSVPHGVPVNTKLFNGLTAHPDYKGQRIPYLGYECIPFDFHGIHKSPAPGGFW